MPRGTDFPPQSMAVIISAYEELGKKVPLPRDDQETFLNGFLFGMRWGLGISGAGGVTQRQLMDAFMGEARSGNA